MSTATPQTSVTHTGVSTAIADLPSAPPSSAQLDPLIAELNLEDSSTILFFGSHAQEELTRVSDSMLERVRVKDLGGAGEALNEMVLTLRGFHTAALDSDQKSSWLDRLFNRGRSAAKLLQRYEQVRDQVEALTTRLERHQTDLLVDIEHLDRLYAANLISLRQLEAYIAAGERKLDELEQRLTSSHLAGTERTVDATSAYGLGRIRAVRDDLERRVHDLRLTRQVTLQSLPGIRLVQENDKALIGKISSTLVNTVPLWRQQLAQALTIERAREAAATVNAATDLTNDLLRANARNLRQANRDARQQIERGVFDIDAVGEANRLLIETIEDSLRIAEDGRAARTKACAELSSMEQQLRQSLQSAHARQQATVAPSHTRARDR